MFLITSPSPFYVYSVKRGESYRSHNICYTRNSTRLDSRQPSLDPKKIKMFVLDEADVMIAQQGHQDQSIRIHK